MSKRLIYALVVIACTVVVLIFNTHSVTVNLIARDVRAMASLVFLVFVGIGVAIGVLLR